MHAIKYHDSRHHRKPRSKGGETSVRNISIVPRDDHRLWHSMFANKDPQEICEIINQVWLDPDYKFICVKAKYLERIIQ